ncbi:peptide ABC transporter substrate-binding protein [Tengunoibacter tsumagoiensis]|uniref:peptide ABC transporter substrate-binding protein n=1 Tax=Tengunoibacter tsumagoiensis TaxID=2014871 RepID=UPI001386611E|nr:peptide ABC transporter substrate-binding protein [Tengunoibacter tsumagoiensis]
MTFPNVGIADLQTLDPAVGLDQNATLVANMIYSGLVRTDKDLKVIPDQATWQIADDGKVYTFFLNAEVAFSDGTPVTAQTYIYTWNRVFNSTSNSSVVSDLNLPIAGLNDFLTGKQTTISGLQALNAHTLQVTLTQPAPYFLSVLTNPAFFAVNQQVVEHYQQEDWSQHVADSAVGTGPFMVQSWQHNVKMLFIPNPHYIGKRTNLAMVDMRFVDDPIVAFKASNAGQYDLVWGMDPQDQPAAKGLAGFAASPQLQTDALFFDPTQQPFDALEVRQALTYAIDRSALAHTILHDVVVPTTTILPPGMPGYQEQKAGLSADVGRARDLLKSVYPDLSAFPPITLSFPNSQLSVAEGTALQQMWQQNLGIQVSLQPVEENAYEQELDAHSIAFGFVGWAADFPDPYDVLAVNLLSTSNQNPGQWKNDDFDQAINQAEATSGQERLALYQKAEQIALTDVAWFPLDHQKQVAVLSSWVHGVTVNANGLYFGDWSSVYLSKH